MMKKMIKTMEKNQYSAIHKHEFHNEKLKVIRGVVDVKIGNKIHTLKEKEKIIIPLDNWHQLISKTDCQIESVLLREVKK